jgi:hypothetical protein
MRIIKNQELILTLPRRITDLDSALDPLDSYPKFATITLFG